MMVEMVHVMNARKLMSELSLKSILVSMYYYQKLRVQGESFIHIVIKDLAQNVSFLNVILRRTLSELYTH